jgi:hypothetical protein
MACVEEETWPNLLKVLYQLFRRTKVFKKIATRTASLM